MIRTLADLNLAQQRTWDAPVHKEQANPRSGAELEALLLQKSQGGGAWVSTVMPFGGTTTLYRYASPSAVPDWHLSDTSVRERGIAVGGRFVPFSQAKLIKEQNRGMSNDSKDAAFELVLWGRPKGKKDALHEQVLLAGPNATPANVEKVKVLAAKDGWHSFRVVKMNMSEKPDFAKGVRDAAFGVAQANAALRKAGYAERVVRGRGYYYFSGGAAESWYSSSIPVYSLSDWTAEEIIRERNSLANDRHNVTRYFG